MRKLILLPVLIFLNACMIVGLTNDFEKLGEDQKALVLPLNSFDSVRTGYIYKINATTLKQELKRHPNSLVYVFTNGCAALSCQPLNAYKDFADVHGYKLFLVMNGFGDLEKTIKQKTGSPLYVIDNDYYNVRYRNVYTRYFENELINLPLKAKWNERDTHYRGNLFYYQFDSLVKVSANLPGIM